MNRKTPNNFTCQGSGRLATSVNIEGDHIFIPSDKQAFCDDCDYFRIIPNTRTERRLCIFTGERLPIYLTSCAFFHVGGIYGL